MVDIMPASNEVPIRLPRSTPALFVPAAGVIIFNAPWADVFPNEMDFMNDTLLDAKWHEWYHLLQTVCSGYAYLYSQNIARTAGKYLVRSHNAQIWAEMVMLCKIGLVRLAPGFMKQVIPHEMFIDLVRYNYLMKKAIKLSRKARLVSVSDHSMVGRELPEMFLELELVRSGLMTPGRTGLSAFHVVEGGAVVYQVLARAQAVDSSDEALDELVMKAFEAFDTNYAVGYEAARLRYGTRASRLFLPAAAVSLQYERPGDALLPMLEELSSITSQCVIEQARALLQQPLAIEVAGRFIGTAAQASTSGTTWRKWRPYQHSPYGAALKYLSKSEPPMDEITILSDPTLELPAEVVTVAIVTKDKLGAAGSLSWADARLRARFAELLLRFDSSDRWFKNAGAEVSQFVRTYMIPP